MLGCHLLSEGLHASIRVQELSVVGNQFRMFGVQFVEAITYKLLGLSGALIGLTTRVNEVESVLGGWLIALGDGQINILHGVHLLL